MRKKVIILSILLLLSLPFVTSAFSVPPKPSSYLLDLGNILDSTSRSSVETDLNSFEKETGNEIAVVTIPSLEGDTIENVAQEIFIAWGIGKKEKNNGVLLLVSKDDHKMRIHVGYGLEPVLTDIVAYHIEQDQIVPYFKTGNYSQGIMNGVKAIESIIRDPNQVNAYNSNKYANSSSSSSNAELYILIFLLAGQWLGSILGRSKSWWAGGIIGLAGGGLNLFFNFLSDVLFINIIIIILFTGLGLFFDYFVSQKFKQNKKLGKNHPWWMGGGGGGSSSGFGGGFSGGGGASSSW